MNRPSTIRRLLDLLSRRAAYPPTRFAALRLASAVLVITGLAGCQLSSPVKPRSTALPTPVLSHPDQPAKPGSGSIAQPSTGSVDPPLRFTLPTPGPIPISLWRPPLYDTPWALGPFDHFYFSRPIAADEVNWPEPDYRYGGMLPGSKNVHTGVDIPAPRNTPVLAAGNGRIVSAGYGLFTGSGSPNDPYGLAVVIRHEFGFQGQRLYTIYAHMDKVLVTEGQDVKTGDALGLVGTTGNTTGPHLHFEVRLEQNSFYTTYNPELWMAPPQGWGVLVGKLENTNGSTLTQQDVIVRNKASKQKWVVRSYGEQAINSDPYYQENLVLSDLPAGRYEIDIDYLDKHYAQDIEIHPGAVSYFTFRGKLSFNTSLPPTPTFDELPGANQP